MQTVTATWNKTNESILHEIYAGSLLVYKVGDYTSATFNLGSGRSFDIRVVGIDKWNNRSDASNVVVKVTDVLLEEFIPDVGTWRNIIKADVSLGQVIPASNASGSWRQGAEFMTIPSTQDFELEAYSLEPNLPSTGEACFGLSRGNYENDKRYMIYSFFSGTANLVPRENDVTIGNTTPYSASKKMTIKGVGETITFLIDDVLLETAIQPRIYDLQCVFSYYGLNKGFTNIKLKYT